MAAAARFLDILQALGNHDVDYIVVGGVAAILEGAPVSTFDIDIMHGRATTTRSGSSEPCGR